MKFKDFNLREQFWYIHPKLRKILGDLEYKCMKDYKTEITITSLIREDDEHSVHYITFKRGADVRSYDFTSDQIDEILMYLNTEYPYGDQIHLTAICHDTGLGRHFHLQVIADGLNEPDPKGGTLGTVGS